MIEIVDAARDHSLKWCAFLSAEIQYCTAANRFVFVKFVFSFRSLSLSRKFRYLYYFDQSKLWVCLCMHEFIVNGKKICINNVRLEISNFQWFKKKTCFWMTTYVVQMSLNIKQFAIFTECNIDTICAWKAKKKQQQNIECTIKSNLCLMWKKPKNNRQIIVFIILIIMSN